MALNRFQHRDCAVTVSALFLSGPRRWRPHLVITRLRENAKHMREQAITDQPASFWSANDALAFGVQQARRLIDGEVPGLRV